MMPTKNSHNNEARQTNKQTKTHTHKQTQHKANTLQPHLWTHDAFLYPLHRFQDLLRPHLLRLSPVGPSDPRRNQPWYMCYGEQHNDKHKFKFKTKTRNQFQSNQNITQNHKQPYATEPRAARDRRLRWRLPASRFHPLLSDCPL